VCRQQNVPCYFMPRSHDYIVRAYLIQIFLRHTLAFCDHLVQCIVSAREHIVYLGEAWLRRQEKTQNSGRQEIRIRYLLITPEDKKEQRAIDINPR
jgi:hypothetical protein